jgi:DNA-binding LacI/PurR family transcriptional regulator
MTKHYPTARATMQEVAAAAGVSTATVSRVLNSPTSVSPELVVRVETAMQTLGYRPSRSARTLRSGRSLQRVGFLVSNIQNSFFTDVLKGVEQQLVARQIAIVVGNSNNDIGYEAINIELMLEEQVSGIIAQFTSTQRKFYQALLHSQAPIVCFDHVPEGLSLDCVMTNNRAAMAQATRHLIELGHRSFGLVGGPLSYITARERQAGFLDALHAAGIGDDAIWIENGDWQIDGSYAAANRLLARTPQPLALLTINNEATIGTLKALQERKLRIPEAVALVAFDEMAWAGAYNPPLTVVNQHPSYQGNAAAELLLARMAEPGRPIQQVVLEAELIVRQSSGMLVQ